MKKTSHLASCQCGSCNVTATESIHGQIVRNLVGWTAIMVGCFGLLVPATIYASQVSVALPANSATNTVRPTPAVTAETRKVELQKAADTLRLKRLKASLNQLNVQMKSLRTKLTALQRQRIVIPDETLRAVVAAEDILKKLSEASTIDSFNSLSPTKMIPLVGEELRGQLRMIERLVNLSKITTRVDARFVQLDRMLAQDKKFALTSKIDVTTTIEQFEKMLIESKEQYAEIRKLLVSGSAEKGFILLEEQLYPSLEKVGEYHLVIQQIVRLSTTIASLDRQSTAFETRIKAIAKRGGEPDAAVRPLADLQEAISRLKKEAGATPVDYQAVQSQLIEIEDMRRGVVFAINALDEIAPVNNIDAGIKVPALTLPNLDLLLETR